MSVGKHKLTTENRPRVDWSIGWFWQIDTWTTDRLRIAFNIYRLSVDKRRPGGRRHASYFCRQLIKAINIHAVTGLFNITTNTCGLSFHVIIRLWSGITPDGFECFYLKFLKRVLNLTATTSHLRNNSYSLALIFLSFYQVKISKKSHIQILQMYYISNAPDCLSFKGSIPPDKRTINEYK